jgi:hypothetical protein
MLEIVALNKCLGIGKLKGQDRCIQTPLRPSLCTKSLKTAAKDMKELFLCIMIPLDEKYIIQNNYEF